MPEDWWQRTRGRGVLGRFLCVRRFRCNEPLPTKKHHRGFEPRIVGRKNHLNDSACVRIGLNPGATSKVCHDVNPTGGNRQVSRPQPRMIGILNTVVPKQLGSPPSVTVPQCCSGAVVPPEGHRVSNRSPVKRSNSVTHLAPNKPLPDKA